MTESDVKNEKTSSETKDVPNKDENKMSCNDGRNSFWFTRVVFLRSLAFIYFVAFLVAWDQNKELIGNRGLLPLKQHLNLMKVKQAI